MIQHLAGTIEDFPVIEGGCVVTIGDFDGLHLGHQAILRKARQVADQDGLPLVAVTFNPTPMKLLRPEKAPHVIMPLAMRVKKIAGYGVDHLVVVNPTDAFLAIEPIDFIERVLVKQLNVKHIVEGQTFNFGRRGAGTMVTLLSKAETYGFKTHLVGSVTRNLKQMETVAISSTLVRQLIVTCQFDSAAICLGRPYVLGGTVVPCRQKGRTLGFPTANLDFYCSDQLIPEDGVFACWVCWGATLDEVWANGRKFMAAVSIGSCETFEDGRWQVEAFILDFPNKELDLTGQHISLEFVEKIRDQQRFKSPERLVEAMGRDCEKIRKRLA